MGNSDNLGNTDCLRDSELTGDSFQLLQGKPGLCRVPNLELQTIPLYLESNFKWSSSGSGFVLLVLIAPGLLGPLAGRVSDRFGPRRVSFTSFLALGPLFVALGYANGDSFATKVCFCFAVFWIGVFMFAAVIPHMAAISIVADRISKVMRSRGTRNDSELSGQAYAFMNMAFAAGLVLGPLWAGPVKERFGWLVMCASFALAEMSPVIVVLFRRTGSKLPS